MIHQRRPFIYQEFSDGRREISAGYVRKGAALVGFQLAAYDPGRAAQLEIRWWAVHRQRDQYPDHAALAAALAATYAEVYRQPPERMLAAAEPRAAAMDLSDQWVREGQPPDSPLPDEIARLLVASYRALSDTAGT